MSEFRGNDRFEVLSGIGHGGMGVVYKALDRERGTTVALKTVRRMSAEAVLRFKKEFRALQDLQHPNLVSYGELIEHEGSWFITMEFIEGVDFLRFVRPIAPDAGETELSLADTAAVGESTLSMTQAVPIRGQLDETRLRGALRQLAEALAALHGSGKVHRDVKPSNVLVTDAGRVVLLDLGLVTEVVRREKSDDHGVVGTADYMAPEQAASRPPGPEADWYSMGVMLYQSLTGRLPFRGAPIEVLLAKQRYEPPPPRSLAPGLAADLDALTVDLMRLDPGARPSGRDILDRLGCDVGAESRGSTASSSPATHVFVGREAELTTLRDAFSRTRAGRAESILIVGESGVGKSALVRRFIEEIDVESVVLAGRCHERESVPYKAFDGVVDALSRHLARIGEREAAALLPRQADLVSAVFPVLRKVKAFAEVPKVSGRHELDPLELRARLFVAVRELLGRISDRQPVVLTIDDLHWADADSLLLLGEILRAPDAPNLLLVATMRDVVREKPEESVLAGMRVLQLDRLPAGDARELSRLLIAGSPAAPSSDAIAEETGGHPLFIDELVRHVLEQGASDLRGVRLDDALRSRARRLPSAARRVLDLVVVAGTPTAQAIIGRAAGIEGMELDRAISLLRLGNLVRTWGVRAADRIEPFHDKVRETILSELDEQQRRRDHLELALALEVMNVEDPLALALHWRDAGQRERAADYALRAAEKADAAFAFDRAARVYELALELHAGSEATSHDLRVRLGGALSKAGRGKRAAHAYLAAASEAPTAAAALDARRRAAEELLLSGHVDKGLIVLRTVLAEARFRMPATPRRALVSLIAQRARLAVRGFKYRERDASEVPTKDLERIDLCFSVSRGFGLVDNVLAADFQTRGLLLALQSGEPTRIARAFALEVPFRATTEATIGARTRWLLERAEEMARRLRNPHAMAMCEFAAGVISFCQGHWRGSRSNMERAIAMFRERCTGVAWELDTVHLFLVWNLVYMGDFEELNRCLPIIVRDAEERGDLYAAVSQRIGLSNLAALALGDVATAQQHIDSASLQWSRVGFHFQHYWRGLAQAQVHLYTGRGAQALEVVEGMWRTLERSLVLRVRLVSVDAHHLYARALLAAAAEVTGERERAKLLRRAEAIARRIRRVRMPWSDPLADLVVAGAAHLRGRAGAAVSALESAARGFDAADMAGYAAASRLTLGGMLGGDEGSAMAAAAIAQLRSRRIAEPALMARMMVAGFAPGA